MPLRRTYASLSLDTLSQSAVNMHDTSAQSVPSVPSMTPAVLQASQPKGGTRIVKLPSTSRRSSLQGPRRSSLLGLRRPSLHHRSSHPDRQIFPHFKPGVNLYRKVLTQEFLRVAKKTTMNDVEAPTMNITMDD
ncbi:hypothetical protein BYT27DRAFT_7338903 [Phlegmacium glaucopus]|nr:hypothetical protein BYT27DRAFT_7338903 [Phlegmacium glaucopus]